MVRFQALYINSMLADSEFRVRGQSGHCFHTDETRAQSSDLMLRLRYVSKNYITERFLVIKLGTTREINTC